MTDNREDVRKMMDKDNIADLRKVTEYLKKNPMANMMQVNTATGVPLPMINSFVRYGVLKIKGVKVDR